MTNERLFAASTTIPATAETTAGATPDSHPPTGSATRSAARPAFPRSRGVGADPASGARRPGGPSARRTANASARSGPRKGDVPSHHVLCEPADAWRRRFEWSADPYQPCPSRCGACRALESASGGPPARASGGDATTAPPQPRLCVQSCFPNVLRRDLRERARPGDHIAFGVAGDPYLRIEKFECVMRASLRELAQVGGLRISVTTRATLVTRDLDLLVQVAARNAVQINLTMSTNDARLARVLAPHDPTPSGSFAALREIRAAGLRAGVFVSPVLPGITDCEADLRSLVLAARDAGAQFVAHRAAFLEPSARAQIVALLRRAYPRVAARHELWSRCGPTHPDEARDQIATRVASIARSCGLPAPLGDWPPAPSLETQRCFGFVS